MKKNIALIATALSVSALVTGCAKNNPKFESFSQIEAGKTYKLSAMTSTASVTLRDGAVLSVATESTNDLSAKVTTEYDSSGFLKSASIKDKNYDYSFPTITASTYYLSGTNTSDSYFEAANPLGFDFEYQTFGVWNSSYTGSAGEVVTAGAFSTGARTEFNKIPTSGNYVFMGEYAGYYTTGSNVYQVYGWLDLAVDFGAKTVALDGYDAELYNVNTDTWTSTSSLDMVGNLKYTDANNFSGPITFGTSLTGTAEGSFYGPSANEAGGLINAYHPTSSSVKLIASFGAKR